MADNEIKKEHLEDKTKNWWFALSHWNTRHVNSCSITSEMQGTRCVISWLDKSLFQHHPLAYVYVYLLVVRDNLLLHSLLACVLASICQAVSTKMSNFIDETLTTATSTTTASTSSTVTSNIKSWPSNGFLAALFCILVSELGDKTFVITTILAMKYSKRSVFLGALTAATLMISLSG